MISKTRFILRIIVVVMALLVLFSNTITNLNITGLFEILVVLYIIIDTMFMMSVNTIKKK